MFLWGLILNCESVKPKAYFQDLAGYIVQLTTVCTDILKLICFFLRLAHDYFDSKLINLFVGHSFTVAHRWNFASDRVAKVQESVIKD